METQILGSPRPEAITGTNISVLAPGFSGRFVSADTSSTTRGRKQGGQPPLAKAAALTDLSLVLIGSIELEAPRRTGGKGGRAGAAGAPRFIVKAQPTQSYAMLHTDDSGRMRWLFPEKTSAQRAAGQAVFALPPTPAIKTPVTRGASANDSSRGIGTKTMRRLVGIVSWATAPLVKAAAQNIARAWEAQARPYGLWQVASGGKLAEPDWRRFEGGVTLLLIHGTFSTPAVGFGSWFASKEFEAMLARYEGRVLALGHPSLSASPDDNVDWLLERLPGKGRWKGSFDVVCHSRGGLVARELAARAALKKAPAVGRVCQVGTPNVGTVLTDPAHWVAFLDAYTNCLTMLPDATSTIVLEGLLCLVKIVGTGAVDGLPGLASMNPRGRWISDIASRHNDAVRWYTVGADYTPAPDVAAGFIERIASVAGDTAIDAFFRSGNDMVVPADGCHEPGAEHVDFLRLADGRTTHTTYFQNAKVRQALARWLG